MTDGRADRRATKTPASAPPRAADTASVVGGGETLVAPPGGVSASPDETLIGLPDPYAGLLAPPQAEGELGRLGEYAVLRELGRGGMGLVFEAEDPRLRRRVALKVMLPEVAKDAQARERFLREARSAAAVEHDHVVPVYQVGEDRGVPFLAMRLLPGESLAELLARKGTLPAISLAGLGRQAALGLSAAHERGLIHRDIKPANLWVEPGGRVRVLDFGLARPTEAAGELTRTGNVVGTPEYLAPEQLRGEELDGRADLFSLGAVLYRAATGASPFRRDTLYATLKAVETEVPADPRMIRRDLPAPLAELILKLLAKKKADRPASAAAVAKTLKEMGPALTKPGDAAAANGPPPAAETPTVVAPVKPAADSGGFSVGPPVAPSGGGLPTNFPVFEPPPVLPSRTAPRKAAAPPPRRRGATATKAGRGQGPPWKSRTVLLAGGGGLFGLGLLGVIFALTIDAGDALLRVEGLDPDMSVTVTEGGKVVRVVDAKTGATAELDPGTYELTLKGGEAGGFTAKLKEETVTLSRGKETVATIVKTPKAGAAAAADETQVTDAGGTAAGIAWRSLLPADGRLDPSRVSASGPAGDPAVGVSFEEGGLRLRAKGQQGTATFAPDLTADDCVLRAKVTFGSEGDAYLRVRSGPWREAHYRDQRGYVLAVRRPGTPRAKSASWVLGKWTASGWKTLGSGPPEGPTPAPDSRELALAAVGDRVTAFLDGEKVLEARDTEMTGGGLRMLAYGQNPDCLVSELEVCVLDGTTVTPEQALAARKSAGPGAVGTPGAAGTGTGGTPGFVEQFIGPDHAGWSARSVPGGRPLPAGAWTVKDRVLECATKESCWLRFDRRLADFELEFEFLVPPDGNSGVFIRHPGTEPLADHGMEVQVADMTPEQFGPKTSPGALYGLIGANPPDAMRRGEWNRMSISCRGPRVAVTLNGTKVVDADMDAVPELAGRPREGYVGLYNFEGQAFGTKFRNVRLREFGPDGRAAVSAFPPLDEAWARKVAGLPPDGQVGEVLAELKRRNAGFEATAEPSAGRFLAEPGKLLWEAEGRVVTRLLMSDGRLADLTPLRALPGLKHLHCPGGPSGGVLQDLSPLSGLGLATLSVNRTKVRDLSPLAGMRLEELYASGCVVEDLTPLRGMPLRRLHAAGTFRDLSPLSGMPLTELQADAPVEDVSPLRGLPLKELSLPSLRPERDVALLRSIPTLEKINGKPAAEFLAGGGAVAVDLLAEPDLAGWSALKIPGGGQAPAGTWAARDGVAECLTRTPSWVRFDRELSDFELSLEFLVPPDGNSGVLIRHSGEEPLPQHGMEVQIIDGPPGKYGPMQVTGAIFSAVPASPADAMKRGEWNAMSILCRGETVAVTLNGAKVAEADMGKVPALAKRPRSGYIGLYSHDGSAAGTKFRNIRLRDLSGPGAAAARSARWLPLLPKAAAPQPARDDGVTVIGLLAGDGKTPDSPAVFVLDLGGENCAFENGGLRLRGAGRGVFPRQVYRDGPDRPAAFRDGVVRARVRLDAGRLTLSARRDADSQRGYLAGVDRDGRAWLGKLRTPTARLREVHLPQAPPEMFELALAVVGDRITAYLDGQRILEARDDSDAEGQPGLQIIGDGAGAFVERFELCVLDGTGLTPEQVLGDGGSR